MSAVRHLKVAAAEPTLLTKQQIAARLERSPRWIEVRAQEGMPTAGLDRGGRRLYDLADCEAWLDARSRKLEEHEPVSMAERFDALEAEVAELRAELQRLRDVA